MVISRDVILGLGALVLLLTDYPLVIKPSLAGKWTTTVQLLTVGLVLLAKAKLWHLPPEALTASIISPPASRPFPAFTTSTGLKLVSQQSEDWRTAVAEVIDLERFRARMAADQGFRSWLGRFNEQFGPETRSEDLSPATFLDLASPDKRTSMFFSI